MSKFSRVLRHRAYAPLASMFMLLAGVIYTRTGLMAESVFITMFGLSKLAAHGNIFIRLMPDGEHRLDGLHKPRPIHGNMLKSAVRITRNTVGNAFHPFQKINEMFMCLPKQWERRAFGFLALTGLGIVSESSVKLAAHGFDAIVLAQGYVGGFIFEANRRLAMEDVAKFSSAGSTEQLEALRLLRKVFVINSAGNLNLTFSKGRKSTAIKLEQYHAPEFVDLVLFKVKPLNQNYGALNKLKKFLKQPEFGGIAEGIHIFPDNKDGKDTLIIGMHAGSSCAKDLAHKTYLTSRIDHIQDPASQAMEKAFQGFEDRHQIDLTLTFNNDTLTIKPTIRRLLGRGLSHGLRRNAGTEPAENTGSIEHLDNLSLGELTQGDRGHWENLSGDERMEALAWLSEKLKSIFGETVAIGVNDNFLAVHLSKDDAVAQKFRAVYIEPLAWGCSL